jgi:hypothetical protein
MTTEQQLYDVLAVNIENDTVRFMAQSKTLPNAEAIVKMAVMRRGCDEELYVEVPAGEYQEGGKYSKGA